MVFVALWTQHRPIHLPFSFSTVAAYIYGESKYVNVVYAAKLSWRRYCSVSQAL